MGLSFAAADAATHPEGEEQLTEANHSPAADDYMSSLGEEENGTFLGLEHHEVEDDYTGEASEAQWIAPLPQDDRVRLRRPRIEHVRVSEEVYDLVNAGHGYVVQTLTSVPSNPVTKVCRFCGGSLPQPDKDWICELVYFGAEPEPDCRCNWCMNRRLWEEREYREAGRPRTRCDSPECKRKAKNEHQRKWRAKRRKGRELVGV